MKRSESRILTTHTGSLPRSPRLQELLRERKDQAEFDPERMRLHLCWGNTEGRITTTYPSAKS